MGVLSKLKTAVKQPFTHIVIGLGIISLLSWGVDLPIEMKVGYGFLAVGSLWVLAQKLGILKK